MRDKGMGLVELVVAMVIMAAIGLAVASMVSMMSGKSVRRASYSSLELQALSYARANLEALRNAVGTDSTRSAFLTVSATSYDTTSSTAYTGIGLNPLPSDFSSAPVNGTRTYLVSSVSTDPMAPKKVKVTVQWNDA